jgi:hypothetical protein
MPNAKSWTVAFVGDGDVSEDNAKELLDTQLFPVDAPVQALLPKIPQRGHKGLRAVADLLRNEFDIPARELPPARLTAALQEAREAGEEVCLVILGTEDDDAVMAAEAALDAGIDVKDLCAALDDVEFEPEAVEEAVTTDAPRRRGRPRKDATVEARVDGPAAIPDAVAAGVSAAGCRCRSCAGAGPADALNRNIPAGEAAALLERAVRMIIREELAMHPGVHAFGEGDEPAEPGAKTVRAFVNGDGKYRRATKRSRVREDETEVMITEAEAQEAGLTG